MSVRNVPSFFYQPPSWVGREVLQLGMESIIRKSVYSNESYSISSLQEILRHFQYVSKTFEMTFKGDLGTTTYKWVLLLLHLHLRIPNSSSISLKFPLKWKSMKRILKLTEVDVLQFYILYKGNHPIWKFIFYTKKWWKEYALENYFSIHYLLKSKICIPIL